MNNEELRKEIEQAKHFRQARAAFGSILRRHIEELGQMSTDEKILWLKEIGAPYTYLTEISKELSVWRYDNHSK